MGVIVEESTDLETNLANGQKPNLLKTCATMKGTAKI